ncbi:hypothetical protein [Ectobacillus panaciterrae]|uniref:hypothetical protein n=1 Tax=Ectobacillus panaciterrae TaxID=363872 RepID=UPI0003FDEA4C|nr:hypothetical protein [Ectobacillus panaciterrae]
MEKIQFKKIKSPEFQKIHRIEDYTYAYDADLFDDDSKNIEVLTTLFQVHAKKMILHVGEYMREDVEREMQSRNIGYRLFYPSKKNLFIIVESFTEEHILYLISLFYSLSVENYLAIMFFGEGVSIEFEQLQRNKISQVLLGEYWVPCCILKKETGCAFIRYDGALLTVVGNDNDSFRDEVLRKVIIIN